MQKTGCILSIILCGILPHPALAENSMPAAPENPWYMNGSVTLASEYMTRGFSDSDNRPALQGNIILGHNSGWEAEVWASNVDYNDGGEAKVQVDFYLSYTFALGPGDLSLGAGYYTYPAADSSLHYNHGEFFSLYALDIENIGSFGTEFWYAPNIAGNAGKAVYVNTTAEIPLPWVENLSLVGSLGHQWIEKNTRFGAPDYADGSLGLAYTYDPVTLDVRYYDTSISKSFCDNLCGPRMAASLTWNW